jgi:hypothetical protein
MPFYEDPGFWIGAVIGVASLVFSLLAFREAGKAKKAAQRAARIVAEQEVVIKLSNIGARLRQLPEAQSMGYEAARNLLEDTGTQLREIISQFRDQPVYKNKCRELLQTLEAARGALDRARPRYPDAGTSPETVFYLLEGHFSALNSKVADLLGLFKRHTMKNT